MTGQTPAYLMPIHERIDRDYSFGPLDDETRVKADVMRGKFRELAHEVAMLAPNSRERSISLNKLQEAKMWAVQSIVNGEDDPQ